MAQTALPLRYSGFGYTRAADVADAALIGGFTTAAYLGHGMGDMDPSLQPICTDPDSSNLPLISSLKGAWRRALAENTHLRMIAKAAAAGLPGYGPLPAAAAQDADAADQEDGEAEDGDREEPDLEAKYDKAWRMDHIVGGLVAGQVL